MDANRLAAMRVVETNLRAEGHTSRADCVRELCSTVEELQRDVARWVNAHQIAMIERDADRKKRIEAEQLAMRQANQIRKLQQQLDSLTGVHV